MKELYRTKVLESFEQVLSGHMVSAGLVQIIY